MAVETKKVMAFLRRLGPVGPLAVVASTLPAIGGWALLGFLGYIGPWLKSLDAWGMQLYVGSVILLCGLAILPTNALAVLAGWAFGFQWGVTLALTGFVAGAVAAYLSVRWLTGTRTLNLLAEHPKWQAVYRTLLDSGHGKTLGIVILVRMASLPFSLTNLVLAATRVPPVLYLLGTFLGLIPRTTVLTWLGSQLTELDFKKTEHTWLAIGSVLVTLLVLGIIGHMANRAVQSITQAEEPSRSTTGA